MKVFFINPNTGMYEIAKDEFDVEKSSNYQGIYNYIPTYPNYTLHTIPFGYFHPSTEIYFLSMVIIEKFFVKYAVEVRFKLEFRTFNDETFIEAIQNFHIHCLNVQKNFNHKCLNRERVKQ